MNLLRRHTAGGRRFSVDHYAEQGDGVAVALRVSDPGWDGALEVSKVFRFRAVDERVVFMQDCVDWEDALVRLGSG